MKTLNKKFIGLLTVLAMLISYNAFSQNTAKGDLRVAISYFEANNSIPYVSAFVKTKIKGRFQPVGGIALKLYLDKDSAGTFIAQVVTSEKGEAHSLLPPSVKKEWESQKNHTFIAVF